MPVCLSFCVRVCLPGRPETWDWRPAPFYREVIGAGIIDYLIDIYYHDQKSVITDMIPRNRCFIKEMEAISSIT